MPTKLRKAASRCGLCKATATVLATYADWDCDDKSTKKNFASKPGVAMALIVAASVRLSTLFRACLVPPSKTLQSRVLFAGR